MARIKKTDKEKLKRGGDQTGDGAKTAQHGVNSPRERGAGARTRRRVEKAGHVPSTAEFLQQAINRQEAKLRQQAIDRRGTQAGAPPPMLTPNHPRSMGEKDAAAFQQKQDTALANRSVPPEVQQQLDQSQASIAEHKRQQELLDRQTAQINRRMGQVQEGLTPAGTSGFAIPPGDRQLARDAGLNVRYGMVGGQAAAQKQTALPPGMPADQAREAAGLDTPGGESSPEAIARHNALRAAAGLPPIDHDDPDAATRQTQGELSRSSALGFTTPEDRQRTADAFAERTDKEVSRAAEAGVPSAMREMADREEQAQAEEEAERQAEYELSVRREEAEIAKTEAEAEAIRRGLGAETTPPAPAGEPESLGQPITERGRADLDAVWSTAMGEMGKDASLGERRVEAKRIARERGFSVPDDVWQPETIDVAGVTVRRGPLGEIYSADGKPMKSHWTFAHEQRLKELKGADNLNGFGIGDRTEEQQRQIEELERYRDEGIEAPSVQIADQSGRAQSIATAVALKYPGLAEAAKEGHKKSEELLRKLQEAAIRGSGIK